MTLSSDTIQAQLVAARRTQILDAAAIVFAEKGFHSTTIKDIAVKAGIAHGTVYIYFENKSSLLLAIFDRMKASIIEEHMPFIPPTDFRTFLRTFLQLPLLGLKKDNFALFRIVVSEMMVNEELRTLYHKQVLEPTLMQAEAYLQDEAAKRNISPAKIQLVIRAIYGMILGLTLEHTIGDEILISQWEELPDFLADFILTWFQNEERHF